MDRVISTEPAVTRRVVFVTAVGHLSASVKFATRTSCVLVGAPAVEREAASFRGSRDNSPGGPAAPVPPQPFPHFVTIGKLKGAASCSSTGLA